MQTQVVLYKNNCYIWSPVLMLEDLMQAKENQDCKKYYCICEMFVVVQFFSKSV